MSCTNVNCKYAQLSFSMNGTARIAETDFHCYVLGAHNISINTVARLLVFFMSVLCSVHNIFTLLDILLHSSSFERVAEQKIYQKISCKSRNMRILLKEFGRKARIL